MPTIDVVLSRLAGMRRRVRRIFLVDGAAKVLLTIGAGAFAAMSLDLFLRLPYPVRVVTTSGVLLAALYVFRRYVVYPLSKRLTDDDLAVAAERHFADLNDRLISGIQFSRDYERACVTASPALLDHVVADAAAVGERLPLHETLRPRPGNGARILLVVAVGGLFGLAALDDPRLATLARRFAFMDVAFPVDTVIALRFEGEEWPRARRKKPNFNFRVDRDARLVKVVKDSNLRVLARLLERPARTADIVTFAGGRPRERAMQQEATEEGGRASVFFTHRYDNVLAPLEFQVSGGDAATPLWRVEVVTAPRVESMSLTYHYPAYLRKVDDTVSSTEIDAPLGTRVEVGVVVNRPLPPSGAVLQMAGGKGEIEPIVLEPAGPSGREFRTPAARPVEVGAADRFEIVLTDGDGLTNLADRHSRIVAQDDKAPFFVQSECDFGERLGRAAVVMVTPRAGFDVKVTAADDLGLKSVGLVYRAEGGQDVRRPDFARDWSLEAHYPLREALTFRFEPAALLDHQGAPLAVGQAITLHAEARDNTESGNAVKSAPVKYRVVTADYLENEVYKYVTELKEQIEAHQKKQREIIGAMRDALPAFTGDEAADGSSRGAVERARTTQEAISDHARRMTRTFQSILRVYADNRLDDAGQKVALLREVAEEFAAIQSPEQTGDSGQAAALLGRILRERSLAGARKSYDEALARQEACLARFDRIVDRLRRWGSFGEIRRILMDLIANQDVIIRRIGGERSPAARPTPATPGERKEQ